MPWTTIGRTKLAALGDWAARTFLRPDSVVLLHRPSGAIETGIQTGDAAASRDHGE